MHLNNTEHYRGTMVVTITKKGLRNKNELFICLDNYFVRTFAPYYKITSVNGEGKAMPLQACTGPEGSRRLILPYFKKIGT
jgi:hypothetical protein